MRGKLWGVIVGTFALWLIGYGTCGIYRERIPTLSKWDPGFIREYNGYDAIFIVVMVINVGIGLLAHAAMETCEGLHNAKIIKSILSLFVIEIVLLIVLFVTMGWMSH